MAVDIDELLRVGDGSTRTVLADAGAGWLIVVTTSKLPSSGAVAMVGSSVLVLAGIVWAKGALGSGVAAFCWIIKTIVKPDKISSAPLRPKQPRPAVQPNRFRSKRLFFMVILYSRDKGWLVYWRDKQGVSHGIGGVNQVGI